MTDNNVIFEEYAEEENKLSQRLKKPKFWTLTFIALIGIFLIFLFIKFVIMDSWSADEVKRSIEIVWHETKWVDKEISPYEVKIVPSISFKINR